MQRIVYLFIICALVYNFFIKSDIYTNMVNDFTDKSLKNEAIQDQKDNNQQSLDNNQILTGNFLERFVSKVVTNILKTETGKQFFTNILSKNNEQQMNFTFLSTNGEIKKPDAIKLLFKKDIIRALPEKIDNTTDVAMCGDKVDIRYSVRNSVGVESMESKTIVLGKGEIIPAIENVIIGMRVWEISRGVALPAYGYGISKFSSPEKNPTETYAFTVELIRLSKRSQENKKLNFRIFDDSISYETPFLCGQKVQFDLTIEDIKGNLLYKSDKPLLITVGSDEYPSIISQALFAKAASVNRTIIANSRSLSGKYFKFITQPFSFDQYLLVEFKNTVHIKD